MAGKLLGTARVQTAARRVCLTGESLLGLALRFTGGIDVEVLDADSDVRGNASGHIVPSSEKTLSA